MIRKLLTITALAASAVVSAEAIEQARRLTNTVNSYPSPSPDGKHVVFQSNGSGRSEVFVIDIGGDRTNQRQLTNMPGDNTTPAWSPDGRWIAFASGQPQPDIFIMAADGSGVRRLTDHPGDDSHPHWSADSQRLFFNSARGTPDLQAPWQRQWHDIYSMRIDGSDLRRHTTCRSVCTFGSPSPDGKHIVYRKVIDGAGFNWDLSSTTRNSEVFVADIDGRNERNVSANAAYDGWPMWSPNGRLIAFASNRPGPAYTGQIFLIRPDGTGLTQLTRGPWSHVQPAWSSDGTKIYAYQNEESTQSEFGNIVVVPFTHPDNPSSQQPSG